MMTSCKLRTTHTQRTEKGRHEDCMTFFESEVAFPEHNYHCHTKLRKLSPAPYGLGNKKKDIIFFLYHKQSG